MEFERRLIKLVRESKCLYQSKCRSGVQKRARVYEWERVSATIGRSVIDCKQRWRSLRDRFVREKKKIDQGELCPNSDQKWKYYDEMKFLIPSVNIRRNKVAGGKQERKGPKIYLRRELSDNFANISNSFDGDSMPVADENTSENDMKSDENETKSEEDEVIFDTDSSTVLEFKVEVNPDNENEEILFKEIIDEIKTLHYEQCTETSPKYKVPSNPIEYSEKPETENKVLCKRSASAIIPDIEDGEWVEHETRKNPKISKTNPLPKTIECQKNQPTLKVSEQKMATQTMDPNEAFVSLMSLLKTEINKMLVDEKDENDLFLECMGKKMKNLSHKAKFKIQAKLLAIITEELLNEMPERTKKPGLRTY